METYWIWLSELEGLTTKGRIRAISAFGTPEAAFMAGESELKDKDGLRDEDRKALANKDLTRAQTIVEDCWERNIHILTMEDPLYPELLRHIPDPPVVLYYVGRFPNFDEELSIAIVGHRKPTAHGEMYARKLGYELSKAGVIVVSGCAAGIDGAAMTGALRGDAPVVGVLGCGVDVVYPKRNRRLFEDVRDFGCLISEYPPGTPPDKWHFPVRNRIISGLSRGVIVAEAPTRSGSLITARLAAEQGRDVFAVPGSAGETLCAGSNDLLRQGAAFAETADDVIQDYLYLYPEQVHRLTEEERDSFETVFAEFCPPEQEKIAPQNGKEEAQPDKKDIDNRENRTYIDVHEALRG